METETGAIEINDHICLRNDEIRICFSNKGAVVNSVILKKYFLNDKTTNVNLIPTGQNLLNLKLIPDNGNTVNLANYVFEYVIHLFLQINIYLNM